jgi:hypothetical protein
MSRFLVSYDLMSPGRNYKNLTDALVALGARPVLLSQWVVRTNLTATQLRDHLRRFMDTNDRLLVNDFSTWASYNTMLDLAKAA